MTTLTFVAHQDDDLLFLNPDVMSDVQGGAETWICYLTAGNIVAGPAGMGYADQRIQGARAAWARGAKVASPIWDYELITLPSGRQLATNKLRGTGVRLVFTYMSAANGTDNGDLWRMWHNPAFAATPIDGRPSYTRASFIAMLKELIACAGPEFLRMQDTEGNPMGDHIDHTAAARFAMSANLDASGKCVLRADEYFGYIVTNFAENWSGYWRDEKKAAWDCYKPFDSQVGDTSWDNVMGRQYRRHVYWPGDTWVEIGEF